MSGVALVTWISKPGLPNELDLAVIWRGSPGWFMEGTGFSTSGGGTSASFQQTLTYGNQVLSLQFVRLTRRLVILDSDPMDLEEANVVLVDEVDNSQKIRVISKLRIPDKLTGPGELTVPFGRSQEIFEFLRCNVVVPKLTARPIVETLCRDLRAANRGK
jgi:hypothetical protein